MSPAKSIGGCTPSSIAPLQRTSNSHTGSSLPAMEKPVHHDNPVEPVRVKLQDPVGYPQSDTLWSSEGLKSRSSLLFSASQALIERPASFALRAPRLQTKTDVRSVHSGQTTPPSESDEGETTVDNQKEDENERDSASENAEDLSTSWGKTQKRSSREVILFFNSGLAAENDAV
ncbi:hypothetical protein P3T76_003519 [Phytophthora citrophthora]|uniref:Uncharacterized protein n=1 Tax=Phytophthora citrophthora TaxID=4793 RepID=A0AAD9GVS3_9STRA|nr:hypothetical protein P3T76_003519 [Phytophthora citrophthora]